MTSNKKINKELKQYLAGSIEEIREALKNENLDIKWEMSNQKDFKGIYDIVTDFDKTFLDFEKCNKLPSYCESSRTWRVKLSKKPDDKFYDEYVKNCTDEYVENFDHDNNVHQGHYLADCLKEFLIRKEYLNRREVRKFFKKNNSRNIYYQSRASNCNSKKIRGQLFYEQLIKDFFRIADKREWEVFYEIQDYITDKGKSLGRRILIKFVTKNLKDNEDVGKFTDCHVFIPNYYESMDFRTKIDNQVFGVRAMALMVRDDKIYLAKSPEDKYYCIGGAISVGETTEQAVQREVREEVGCDVTVDQLAFVVENQFELYGTKYHQMEFHYLVTPVPETEAVMVEGGRSRTCEWVSIDDLPNLNLNPPFLKTALRDWDGQIKHIVNF